MDVKYKFVIFLKSGGSSGLLVPPPICIRLDIDSTDISNETTDFIASNRVDATTNVVGLRRRL